METAFVTGGASGIGRAVVEMLVQKGIRVYIGDRDVAGAKSAAEVIEQATATHAVQSCTQPMDVADWESQREVFQDAINTLGKIDYVFPIAGITEHKWLPNNPDPDGVFHEPNLSVIDVDIKGVLHSVALAVQHFRHERSEGRNVRAKSVSHSATGALYMPSIQEIITVGSVCGFYAFPSLPVYTAAKHAVVGFVRSYGKALAKEDISLTAVCPNKVRTKISLGSFHDRAEELGILVPMEDVLRAFEKLLPGGEYGALSGECIEVAPQLGDRIVVWMDYINKESEMSAQYSEEMADFEVIGAMDT